MTTELIIIEPAADTLLAVVQPLPDMAILAGQVAPSSVKTYRRDFAAYAAFAGDPETAKDPITLARWRAHLAGETSCSPRTINRMLSAVKRLMAEAGRPLYLGLVTIQEQDADRFFGRESLVTLLVDKLRRGRFLAVLGPSGSGKSSVVLAGLLPALRSRPRTISLLKFSSTTNRSIAAHIAARRRASKRSRTPVGSNWRSFSWRTWSDRCRSWRR